MNKPILRLYEFGPFRLNVTERLLQRSDELVPLTPKLVDTLVVLVENSGHVVTKEGLMQTLWPDSFVEESSLTQNISLLRKALGENGNGQHYIETIPKRGYRFVADVRESIPPDIEMVMQERMSTQILIEEQLLHDSIEPPLLPGIPKAALPMSRKKLSRGTLAVFTGCVVLVSALVFFRSRSHRSGSEAFVPRSIAVLPFKAIGSGTETELIGLGMADAVIPKLTRLQNTTVLPISSVFKYTNRDQDALSIGEELGVEAVLDGTMQIDGNRIRVTAHLIRLSDHKILWSEKFEEPYSSTFALQDLISERLATLLIPSLGGSNNTQRVNRSTENPGAYQDYLMGMHFWNRRTKENLVKAIDYFEQAVNKDSNFALAHALLADCYYLGSQDTYEIFAHDVSLRRANAAATRALELDDTIAEAHTTKAGVALGYLNHDEADREFRRALELNPNYAVAHLRYGYFLFSTLKLDEALSHMKRAQQLDPVSPTSNIALGFMMFMSHDFDGAIKFNRRALELLPDSTGARVNLGLAYIQVRMFPEAIAEFEKLDKAEPLRAAQGKVKTYGFSGRTDDALRILRGLTASKDYVGITRLELAILYSSVGDKNMAFHWLEKARLTRFAAARMKFDPELDSLRSDKRFDERLQAFERLGLLN